MFAMFKQLDLPVKLGLALLVGIIIAALVVAINHFTDRAFDASEDKGAANVRVIVAEKGMSNVENANKAAAEVSRDPVVRNADCVRDSRTPENC